MYGGSLYLRFFRGRGEHVCMVPSGISSTDAALFPNRADLYRGDNIRSISRPPSILRTGKPYGSVGWLQR